MAQSEENIATQDEANNLLQNGILVETDSGFVAT